MTEVIINSSQVIVLKYACVVLYDVIKRLDAKEMKIMIFLDPLTHAPKVLSKILGGNRSQWLS